MSELDVHKIMCPLIERDRDDLRGQIRNAERVILRLRQMLRSGDPSLPNEYDGTAWAPIESDIERKAAKENPEDTGD